MEPIVQMRNIRKIFAAVVALEDMNFDLYPGEVHFLIGENGAGKSTLMKILSGVYTPTEGTIQIDSEKYTSLNPSLSKELGISVIFQELSLVNSISIAENIFLGKLPTKDFVNFKTVDYKTMNKKAKEVLERIGLDLEPNILVEDLTIAEKQCVEICKALVSNAKVIIMDEPTSSLTDKETERLFTIIEELKKENVAIGYISHKLSEIKKIGNRITVLKDGVSVGTKMVSEVKSEDEVIAKMVGREISNKYYNQDFSNIEDRFILRVENYSRKDGKVKDINFSLRKGEILGFSGLVGAGRTELMEAIFGSYPDTIGDVFLNDRRYNAKSPFQGIKQGIGLITEDRRHTGFMNNFTVLENGIVPLSQKEATLGGIGGLLKNREHGDIANKYIEKLNVRCSSVNQMMVDLSGGNQQKVIISKWLAANSELLIFDEPTKGIDVGSKNEIYKIMRALANEGKGIIMVSSELPELISVCDRILVMANGKIVANLEQSEFSEELIMEYATIEEKKNYD